MYSAFNLCPDSVWSHVGFGMYRCLVCKKEYIHTYIPKHQRTVTHRAALAAYQSKTGRQLPSSSTTTATQPSSSSDSAVRYPVLPPIQPERSSPSPESVTLPPLSELLRVLSLPEERPIASGPSQDVDPIVQARFRRFKLKKLDDAVAAAIIEHKGTAHKPGTIPVQCVPITPIVSGPSTSHTSRSSRLRPASACGDSQQETVNPSPARTDWPLKVVFIPEAAVGEHEFVLVDYPILQDGKS